jgi:ribonuclease P protein component
METDSHFRKSERLNNKRMIHQLFRQGRSFYVKPIKVFYYHTKEGNAREPVQVLISVSKKHFKRAVRRNHVKRIIREAYRLNKYMLHNVFDEDEGTLIIGLVYTGTSMPSGDDVQKKIIRVFKRLKWEIRQQE